MNDPRTVVVLGGGVGGLVTANTLRKLLPRQHRVVLVEREANHLFAPSLLWLMTGRRSAGNISRPLERLRRKGIEVVRGEIRRIDPDARRVSVNGETLHGEHLVIALGAELAPEAIPGLPEAGHNFYTLAGAESLRDALHSFRSGRLVVLTAAPAYKCPAAPYEAAMLLEYDCRRRGVRDQVQVELYAAEPGPMGVAGPAVSAAVRQMVEHKGITYHPEHQVTSVDAQARRIAFANDRHAEFDLLAYVPPHRAPAVVREAGLVAESGWVPVDRNTLETKFPGVYAIGDVTGIPLKLGKPLPKAGVFAHAQGEVVAHNIARAITGEGAPARFEGYGECFIETGDRKAGFGKGNFYAEPTPQMALKAVGYRWHIAKVLFEKSWLRRWF
ncbi:MAG: NAD(P)/FAD-dependent oxidoreductase [Candidatus Lambdaproteobacteria bacterium]|nr:NAD(P)/FAD-dependent oxidoreductase [Candidatus Lambdaproteobacteria bacterium]